MIRKPGNLILLHGFLGDMEDFDPLREFLPEFLTISLPGHGGLFLDASVTTEVVLAHLAAEINHLAGGEPFTLGGYSMGGRLAVWLTSLGLVEPRGLVLMGASLGIPDKEQRKVRLFRDREIAKKLPAGDFEKFLDEWYRQPLFGELRNSREYPGILERRLRGDPAQLARALGLFSVGRQPDLTRFRFRQEIMYIAGGEDRKYAEIAAGLRETKTAIIAGAGHAVHLERPSEVGRIIQGMERK
ncbi:MAG: alpha/beta fold hydrolase [Gemmatimonadales bacterium]|nr:alpha/beta fold hydrolase [Gemmatimonadales bacterium]